MWDSPLVESHHSRFVWHILKDGLVSARSSRLSHDANGHMEKGQQVNKTQLRSTEGQGQESTGTSVFAPQLGAKVHSQELAVARPPLFHLQISAIQPRRMGTVI